MQLSKNKIKSITISEPIKFENLVFHPIHFQNKHSSINLKTLDDLFDENKIIVEELDYSGSVPKIRIINNSIDHLVVIDGEAIEGAKQNRIIENTAIISNENSTLVPVNCVEKGRWHYKSSSFEKASFSLSPKIRNRKTEYLKNGFDSQSVVWDEIDQLAEKSNKYSITSDLGEILTRKKTLSSDTFLNEILKTECNGFILQGVESSFIELFYNSHICSNQIKKNINGWIAEQINFEQDKLKANYILNEFLFIEFREHKNIGVENSFITCNELNGKAVLFNEALIHGFYYY